MYSNQRVILIFTQGIVKRMIKKTEKAAVAEKKVTKTKAAVKPAKKHAQAPLAHGTGRRKSSVARVWLRRGKGNLTVNGREGAEYFDTEVTHLIATTPFRICKEASNYDVQVNIYGGGVCAQADAVKLGIARALLETNDTLRPLLREHGLLTVDSRLKERKKYGQKGARRKFQFVKR